MNHDPFELIFQFHGSGLGRTHENGGHPNELSRFADFLTLPRTNKPVFVMSTAPVTEGNFLIFSRISSKDSVSSMCDTNPAANAGV